MSLQLTDGFTGWVTPTRVFDGTDLLDSTSVYIRRTVVERIGPARREALSIDGIISPGFLDLQVNGGGGVLFNDETTVTGIRKIVAAHRSSGTTHLLPTLITDEAAVLELACHAIIDGRDETGVAGIHIEGPHISRQKAGVHRTADIRPLDKHTFMQLRLLRDHNIAALITVAPESVAPGQISELVDMGVVVSLGHSNAGILEIEPCIAEGATLFTHLFNAMSAMTSREPGMVGTAINSDAYCSIICDGQHVAPQMLKIAINARPRKDRMIIVSDAMPTVGGSTSYELYGDTVKLQGKTLLTKNGALAGAHITMSESVDYLHNTVGVSLESCLRMAVTNPATLIRQNERRTLIGNSVTNCIVISPHATSQARTLDNYLQSDRP